MFGLLSLAGVFLSSFTARVAVHLTAPLETTPTLPRLCQLMGVVTPTATHKVTTIRTCKKTKLVKVMFLEIT